jgi:hypothetical protein
LSEFLSNRLKDYLETKTSTGWDGMLGPVLGQWIKGVTWSNPAPPMSMHKYQGSNQADKKNQHGSRLLLHNWNQNVLFHNEKKSPNTGKP